MKKHKKIIYILMIAIAILSNLFGFINPNKVKAVSNEGELYSKGQVYYRKDGKEYPAYGIDGKQTTVTPKLKYSVNTDELVTNQRIWRAIVNGYPFKTLEELGLEHATEIEAYIATKIAVYDAKYNYDLDKFSEDAIGSMDNKATIEAAKKIIKIAREETSQTKIPANLIVKEKNTKWQMDNINKNYASKTYSVTASAENNGYSVYLTGENISNLKITDINNNPKTKFSSDEEFKILLPISSMQSEEEFNINITSSLKTIPVYYGKNENENYEAFAIAIGEYEETKETYKQTYESNKTEIEIIKQDGDTKTPLEDTKFNLLDESMQILYSDLTTNNEGIIKLSGIMPGTYYLEETKTPDGYYGYEEPIKIQIGLQEKVKITIDNFKEEKKVVPEEPKESHYTPNKKLPATGF